MIEIFAPKLADEIEAMRYAVRLTEYHVESWKLHPDSEACTHATRRLASLNAVLKRLLSIKP